MSKKFKPVEAVAGSYTPLPHALLDAQAFVGASDRAKSMLLELLRQHTGKNNGHLQLSVCWLKKRGWKSVSAIQLAKAELLERGLVILTRKGGLNAGPDHFAVTWLNVSNYVGLDLKPGGFAPGAWRFADPMPVMSKRVPPPPETRAKRKSSSGSGSGAVPMRGTGGAPAVPTAGTKTALFGAPTVPATGNNEVTSSLPASVQAHGRANAPPRPIDQWSAFRNARRFDMSRFTLASVDFLIDRTDHARHQAGELDHAMH